MVISGSQTGIDSSGAAHAYSDELGRKGQAVFSRRATDRWSPASRGLGRVPTSAGQCSPGGGTPGHDQGTPRAGRDRRRTQPDLCKSRRIESRRRVRDRADSLGLPRDGLGRAFSRPPDRWLNKISCRVPYLPRHIPSYKTRLARGQYRDSTTCPGIRADVGHPVDRLHVLPDVQSEGRSMRRPDSPGITSKH